MSRRGKIYVLLTALTILAIVAIEYNRPKEVNWFPSYAKHHKIPLGTMVFHDQLERLFTSSNIVDVDRPPYEFLQDQPDIEGTYVFINDGLVFGKAELAALLDWTSNGNTLVLAASSGFEEALKDTLSLKQSSVPTFDNFDHEFQVELVNDRLEKDSLFVYDKTYNFSHFSELDSLNAMVIGTVKNLKGPDSISNRSYVNVMRHRFGQGEIILSTFPQAFSNHFILDAPNNIYTSGLTSYLDGTRPIYYDNHHKSGKTIYTSPLRVMLNTRELKWAYYVMLVGVLIYILFEGKRKQRAIPVVEPLKNQTVDFTRTISNMYYEKGQHKVLSDHVIHHFMDYVRTHLHLNTSNIDEEFIKNLAARSNNSLEDTKVLFKAIEDFGSQDNINNLQLERLNTLIENFKSNNTWKTKT